MARRKKKSGADLATRFAKLSEAITTGAEKELFAIGVTVKEAAQNEAPVKTGSLRAGIAVRMRYRDAQPVAVVGSLVPHATYVEFAEDIGGHKYGKKLKNKPGRVIYKALDDNLKEINQRVADAIGRVLSGVEGA